MRRVFVNENDAIPGQEWFLNRQYPLTVEIVEGDMEAMSALIEKTFDRVVYRDDRSHKTALEEYVEGYVRRYVKKIASNHSKVC